MASKIEDDWRKTKIRENEQTNKKKKKKYGENEFNLKCIEFVQLWQIFANIFQMFGALEMAQYFDISYFKKKNTFF